jgi:hypothetical protein
MHIGLSSMPNPGNAALQVRLATAVPSLATLFVAGWSDQLGGALPWPLPGGCSLLVAPDVVLFHLTSASGAAAQPLPVPNLPGVVGLRVFAQWLQVPAGAFHTSDALTIRVGT